MLAVRESGDRGVTGRVPGVQVARVETGVLQVASLAPPRVRETRRLLGVQDVGLAGVGCQRHLAVADGRGTDPGPAGVGQLVDGEAVRAEARRHLPGGRAAGRVVVVELLVAVPRQQVLVAVEHLRGTDAEAALAIGNGAADAAGEGDLVAVPVEDLLLLEELGRQVALPDVGVEGVPVGLTGPALELDERGLAENRIGVPDVLLVVADEPDDLRVQALVGGAAVVQVVGPVRPQRGALVPVGPLGTDLPALVGQLPAQSVRQPAGLVVHVDVEALSGSGRSRRAAAGSA